MFAGQASFTSSEGVGAVASLGEGPYGASPSFHHVAMYASAGASAGSRSSSPRAHVRGRAGRAKAVVGTTTPRSRSSTTKILRLRSMMNSWSSIPLLFILVSVTTFIRLNSIVLDVFSRICNLITQHVSRICNLIQQ